MAPHATAIAARLRDSSTKVCNAALEALRLLDATTLQPHANDILATLDRRESGLLDVWSTYAVLTQIKPDALKKALAEATDAPRITRNVAEHLTTEDQYVGASAAYVLSHVPFAKLKEALAVMTNLSQITRSVVSQLDQATMKKTAAYLLQCLPSAALQGHAGTLHRVAEEVGQDEYVQSAIAAVL